jgi:hypothetical protein
LICIRRSWDCQVKWVVSERDEEHCDDVWSAKKSEISWLGEHKILSMDARDDCQQNLRRIWNNDLSVVIRFGGSKGRTR